MVTQQSAATLNVLFTFLLFAGLKNTIAQQQCICILLLDYVHLIPLSFCLPDNPAAYHCARQVMLFALALYYSHAVDHWYNMILQNIYKCFTIASQQEGSAL